MYLLRQPIGYLIEFYGRINRALFFEVVKKLLLFLLLCWSSHYHLLAYTSIQDDSLRHVPRWKELFNTTMFCGHDTDSMIRLQHKKTFFHVIGHTFTKIFREFNRIDTSYIEPQAYNYTLMLQNTNSYEVYRISSKKGHSITFAPQMSYKLGPYFGWRWMFLGYTIDLKHINGSDKNRNKKELDISLYSSMLGLDFFWRKTGNNYKIRNMNLGSHIRTDAMRNIDFGGFNASIRGINVYYIFNHKKFSYPAAYSQSTIQKRSAGSAMLGIGYTKHTLNVNWQELDRLVQERLHTSTTDMGLDSNLLFGQVEYTDMAVSGGYAYNWVFAKKWLFDASLMLSLSYKQSKADMSSSTSVLKDFNIRNFNLDGVGRFGLVYNNMKWYAGASAILHAYNYNKRQFSTNNFFGTLNFYLGVNFGKK